MSTYYVQARTYSQFYLETRRHRLSYKNPRKKEQARKPLLLFRAGMTEGAPRDRAGYLATLVVTRWVLVRVGDPWCLRLAGSLPTLQRLRMAAWWVKGLATRPTLHCHLAALQGFSHELLLQRSRPTNPTTTLHFLQLSTGSLSLSRALFRRANAAFISPPRGGAAVGFFHPKSAPSFSSPLNPHSGGIRPDRRRTWSMNCSGCCYRDRITAN